MPLSTYKSQYSSLISIFHRVCTFVLLLLTAIAPTYYFLAVKFTFLPSLKYVFAVLLLFHYFYSMTWLGLNIFSQILILVVLLYGHPLLLYSFYLMYRNYFIGAILIPFDVNEVFSEEEIRSLDKL